MFTQLLLGPSGANFTQSMSLSFFSTVTCGLFWNWGVLLCLTNLGAVLVTDPRQPTTRLVRSKEAPVCHLLCFLNNFLPMSHITGLVVSFKAVVA